MNPEEQQQPGATFEPTQPVTQKPQSNPPAPQPPVQNTPTSTPPQPQPTNDPQTNPPIDTPPQQPVNPPEESLHTPNPEPELPTQDQFEHPEETQAPEEHIEWQASEFIHHEKNFGWFVLLFMATTVVMVLMFLILKDILSVVVIGLMAIALGVFANRKPRILNYTINASGVTVGEKNYTYESFRSFSVMNDGGMQTIVVDPIQKFMPPITIYCEPQDIDKIVHVLTFYLPHEDKELDWVDRFAKRIRF